MAMLQACSSGHLVVQARLRVRSAALEYEEVHGLEAIVEPEAAARSHLVRIVVKVTQRSVGAAGSGVDAAG